MSEVGSQGSKLTACTDDSPQADWDKEQVEELCIEVERDTLKAPGASQICRKVFFL